jgi:hypothetical protein
MELLLQLKRKMAHMMIAEFMAEQYPQKAANAAQLKPSSGFP